MSDKIFVFNVNKVINYLIVIKYKYLTVFKKVMINVFDANKIILFLPKKMFV